MGQVTILLIKEIYYPILAAISVPANLLTIVILSRGNCSLSKCISIYITAMATADLLVMMINVILYYIFSYHFPFSFLSHTPVCQFILYMTVVTLDLSVWFTVSFTFDRFVAICCQKLKTRYCTERTAAAVITTFSVLIFFQNIPFFFAFEPQQIINKVQWGCLQSAAYFSSPLGAAHLWFHLAWIVWVPFTSIFLFNSLTIRHIVVASKARRGLRGHKSDNQCDPEIQKRRKSIILLFTISASFILLWLTAALTVSITGLANINDSQRDHKNARYIASETGAMLKLLNSCPNTCIYAVTQRKFRKELKKILQSPRILILRFAKKWKK
ncbi:probable G-protein coupled receptor 139 [Heterodontus francisci]|uniref:probable G-protein coupled receptor 139 n=1 Tax=Heterodontus francisci TaxID=7792 RepID=UPI00355C4FBD